MIELAGSDKRIRLSVLDQAYHWFHRVVAVYCLVFGLLYWIRLVGYYDGTLWRFDLMPLHWQVAAVSLAVLFPFAASGLWMVASWGPVIWIFCAGVETVMYAGFPELFGDRRQIVLSHFLTVLLFAAFRVAFFVDARRRRSDD